MEVTKLITLCLEINGATENQAFANQDDFFFFFFF
jgi:hypothetical protein